MRPIKEIGSATHFCKVPKTYLIDLGEMTETEIESDTPSVDEIFESKTESKHKGYAWMPVQVDPTHSDYNPKLAKHNDIKELDMVQISEKRIFVRKANLRDFNKAIENCKPTVNSVFLELYGRFLDKYGHSDQKEFGEIQ